jgi:non-heme chloroperoxidase
MPHPTCTEATLSHDVDTSLCARQTDGSPAFDLLRRDVLTSGLATFSAAAMPINALAAASAATNRNRSTRNQSMNYVTTRDGVEIFYKDWGPKDAQPIVFHHGWPLSSDDWDAQMMFFLGKGFRVVAHDRRGHGRSSQVDGGHDMDHYAADAAAVAEHLNLRKAIHVGHSTGGGEAARYVSRHGRGRVAGLVMIGAVPPIMLKTAANPGGLPVEVFDGYRAGLAANRSQNYLDIANGPFYGFNRPGVAIIPGLVQNWWRQGMMGSIKAQYDGVKAFSETDFTEDLRLVEVPTLVLHGGDDQVVPIEDSAKLSVKLLRNGSLKIHDGLPHGMISTHADLVNDDILDFIRK